MEAELKKTQKSSKEYKPSLLQPKPGGAAHEPEPLQFSSCLQPTSGYSFTGFVANASAEVRRPLVQRQELTPALCQAPLQRNNTGLPDNLKTGIENLSGHSMDDVKVHYHSAKPAQLQAHAYAQGTDIHLASGQEQHLPHEAWHVVQQKQGRVKPTAQLESAVNINDDQKLEREADVMGARAIQLMPMTNSTLMTDPVYSSTVYDPVVQKVDWDWWSGKTPKWLGKTAGIVGGTAGAITGAAKGLWNKGTIKGMVEEGRQGASDGYEHPLTAVGTLGVGGAATLVASPYALTGLAVIGGAGLLGNRVGAKLDSNKESHIPQRHNAPVFNGDIQHDILAELLAHNATSSDVAATTKANILERSTAPVLRYGGAAQTDERVDVTGCASYLHKQNNDWAAELKARQGNLVTNALRRKTTGPRQDQKMSWEVFQDGVNHIDPYPHNPPAPWFMGGGGYQLNKWANQQEMTRIGLDRTQRLRSNEVTAQEKLGGTYQHDVGAYANHNWAGESSNITQNSGNGSFTVNKVLILSRGGQKICFEINRILASVVHPYFTVEGKVLRGPDRLFNYNTGEMIELAADGTGIFRKQGMGGWQNCGGVNAELVSQKYYQTRTVPTDYLGGPNASMGAQQRNRGPQLALNDARFETVHDRMNDANTPLSTALGPWRGNNTWDGEQLGFNVKIAEYRRLGGDVVFQEANHNHPQPYNADIAPSNEAEVTNANWYHERQRSMQGRFVGGRSNSTLGYMSTGTLLYHENLLTLNQAKAIMAFVIADMVVSGEHSLPECITTVIQAGAGMEPWKSTGIHQANNQQALYAWLKLVDRVSKTAMEEKTRQQLVNALRKTTWNYDLLQVLTILDKVLFNAG
jgi:Domain of unknown function (DUF4157)